MKVNISKIKELAKEKGISIAFICKKFGMGRSYFNDILKSNGGDIPNDRLSIIIKILDTSLEYLTDQTDDKSAKPTLSTSDNQIQSNDSFDMFWERFVRLCVENNTKPNPVAKQLGISSGAVTRWKNGAVPHSTALAKIADFFGVPVSYFSEEKEQDTDRKGITFPSPEANAIFLNDKNIYMIPLFESVSAGFGACAVSDVLDYVPCYITNPADAENSICIKVTGDSMHPKIEDGDIIQVHRQTSVDSGQIAVILLDGEEGLVKKVVYGDNWIELHSINPMYPMQRFEGRDVLRIRVVGLVKTVIKNI